MMRDAGAKSFENFFFTKDQLANMTPDEKVKALQFMVLHSEIAKKQREQAKLAKFATPKP